jgi:hypothetical protein
MEQVPVELATWAVGPGLSAIARATDLLDAGADAFAVATDLRRDHPADRAAFAAAAAHTRVLARRSGIARAGELVLTREGLEQASAPEVAAWRARRAAATGAPLQDWCAGTGGDAVALAAHGPVVAVEADPGRAVLARHRAAVLGVPVDVVVGDVLASPVDARGALVHADPDRRDGSGRRARTLATHGPPVGALLTAAHAAAGVLVAVAPGTAWDDPDLPPDAEVVFCQVGQRLVEAVVAVGAAATGARSRAVLLHAGVERTATPGAARAPVGAVGAWLVRPAVAAVRARFHDELAAEIGGWRIADRRALLTADDEPPPSPWWSAERVLAVVPARPRAVRDVLRTHPDVAVELLLHGFVADPVAFLRRAGRPRTGPDDVRVHLVRRDDDAVAIVTASDKGDDPGRPASAG